MLTEEQILSIVNRPVVDQDAPLKQFQLETGRLIEQAVRKEMEGDAKDAGRYRWLRVQLFDDMVDLFASTHSEHQRDAAIDAARGQT